MILSREILRANGIDDKTITRIMNKAYKFGVTFDKMARDKRDWIVTAVHFKKEDWINGQKDLIKRLRFDHIRSNLSVLKVVEGLK